MSKSNNISENLNQINHGQNGQDQANDRERSKKISIVDTQAINSLTEKINKLADNIGLLIQAQNESIKKQYNIYQAILTSNQNQVKLLALLTKKFFPEENEIAPSIDNDQSKNK